MKFEYYYITNVKQQLMIVRPCKVNKNNFLQQFFYLKYSLIFFEVFTSNYPENSNK